MLPRRANVVAQKFSVHQRSLSALRLNRNRGEGSEQKKVASMQVIDLLSVVIECAD